MHLTRALEIARNPESASQSERVDAIQALTDAMRIPSITYAMARAQLERYTYAAARRAS